MQVINISSNELTPATTYNYALATIDWMSTVVLSNAKILNCYRDDNNSYFGTTQIMNLNITTSSNFIGVATESKNSGQSVLVSYGDEINGFTGLTQGVLYYVADNGALSESVGTGHKNPVAIALSPTKIKWFGAGKCLTV